MPDLAEAVQTFPRLSIFDMAAGAFLGSFGVDDANLAGEFI